jgi:hypothetical protein
MRRATLTLAALALLLSGAGKARADFIVNGGFETGDFTGWTPNGGFLGVSSNQDGFLAHGGDFFAFMGTVGGLGSLTQVVTDVAGQTDTLSMYLGSDGQTPNEFKVVWDGVTLYDQTNLPDTRGNSSQYNLLTFTVQATGSDTLTIFERNDPGFLALDDVSLNPADASAAPEPASLTLLGIGVACSLGYAWRRRKQPAAG